MEVVIFSDDHARGDIESELAVLANADELVVSWEMLRHHERFVCCDRWSNRREIKKLLSARGVLVDGDLEDRIYDRDGRVEHPTLDLDDSRKWDIAI